MRFLGVEFVDADDLAPYPSAEDRLVSRAEFVKT
jgi:hypothetical protein